MSQDNMIKFQCSDCGNLTHYSRKNKKTIRERLSLRKHCKFCKKTVMQKETK